MGIDPKHLGGSQYLIENHHFIQLRFKGLARSAIIGTRHGGRFGNDVSRIGRQRGRQDPVSIE